MTAIRPRAFLLIAACLLGGTRVCAAPPPAAATSPAPSPAVKLPDPAGDTPAVPRGVPPAVPPAAPPGPAKPETAAPAPVRRVAAGGILGRAVVGPDNQAVGRVVDVLVDAASNPRAAVIDFGGFMGVGSRRIAVDWSDLSFPPVSATGGVGDIKLDLTAEQIMSAPEYSDQTKPAAVVEPPPAASGLAKPEPGH